MSTKNLQMNNVNKNYESQSIQHILGVRMKNDKFFVPTIHVSSGD